MSMSFAELRANVFEWYEDGHYQEALDLVNREAPHFPAEAKHTYYWRVCLTSRVGDIGQALRLLGEAVAAGFWYPVSMLRSDSDLAPLQGLPEFERLLSVCKERSDETQAKAVPMRLTLEPDGQQPAPLLVALHGNNGNAQTSAEYWRPASSDGWHVLLPQSSQVSGPDAYVWNDRDWSVREVRQHHAEVCAQAPVDSTRTVVGGFSMGGGLAVWLALSGAIAARGFVAVGPYLPNVEELRQVLAERQPQGMRGYIVIGGKDKGCHEVSKAVAAMMHEHGLPCELEVHPDMGHVFPPAFDQSLQKALQFVMNG